MTGGSSSRGTYLKTTEFIDQNGSTPGKDLPYSFASHCMSYMNTTHSILIGGVVDGRLHQSSVILNEYFYLIYSAFLMVCRVI